MVIRRLIAAVMASFLFLGMFSYEAHAQENYNAHDTAKISAFLKQTDTSSMTNAAWLGFDPDDPASWTMGIEWVESGGEKRVSSIGWNMCFLSGPLDLSDCTALRELSCSDNQITSLNVSGCLNLQSIICFSNMITSLSISGCENLVSIDCGYNRITAINATGLSTLTTLTCSVNQLSSLVLTGCNALRLLHCGGNALTSLTVKDCIRLEELRCGNNPLVTVNLTNLLALKTVDLENCSKLQTLVCSNNSLTSLSLGGCSALTSLDCTKNKLTSINLSGPTFTQFFCRDNPLQSVNVTLACGVQAITTLGSGTFWVEYQSPYGVRVHETPVSPAKFDKWVISEGLINEGSDTDEEIVLVPVVNTVTAKFYYCIRFDANGGSGTPPADIGCSAGEQAALPSATDLAKAGYAFSGWNTSPNGMGEHYDKGGLYTMGEGEVTLYAEWAGNYSADMDKLRAFLSYDTGGNVTNSDILGYVLELPGTWDGVTWTESGSKLYLASVNWQSKKIAGTLDLYGCESLNSIDCRETKLSGIKACYGQFAYTAASAGPGYVGVYWTGLGAPVAYATAISPAVFIGWTGAVASANASVELNDVGTYTANFGFIITFDAQGGTVTPATKAVVFGGTYGTLPTPEKVDFSFGGWYTGTNGSGTQIMESTVVNLTADQTLYAKWTANPPPQPAVIPVGLTCQTANATLYGAANGSITIVATGGNSGAYEYSADNGATWQAANVFNVGAGTYTAAVRDANNTGNTASAAVEVGQPRLAWTGAANKMPAKVTVVAAWVIKPVATPKGYTLKSVTYTSSNRKIAYVDAKGNVTFLKGGKVKITVTSVFIKGKTTKTVKTVKQITVNQLVSSITLNKDTAALKPKKTLKLIPKISPSSATNKKAKWKSSDTKVATVSSTGVVTAKKKGTVVITCTAQDGSKVSASCTVTVN